MEVSVWTVWTGVFQVHGKANPYSSFMQLLVACSVFFILGIWSVRSSDAKLDGSL